MRWSLSGGLISAEIPPGRYYLGDPHAALPLGSWSSLLAQLLYRPVADMFGGQVLAFKVKNGNYCDQYGTKYRINSGYIGVVPLSIVPNIAVADRHGQLVQWATPTTCVQRPGTLQLGPYTLRRRSTRG